MRTRLMVTACGVVLLTAAMAMAQECETFRECMAGMCQNGACVAVPLNSGSCDDSNPCTDNDTCVAGECMGTPKAGADCNDFNECTGGDKCTLIGTIAVCMGTTVAENDTPCAGGCGKCQQLTPQIALCRPDPEKQNQACTPGQDLGPCFVGTCMAPGGQVSFCSPTLKQCPDVDGDPCTGEYCDTETGECATAPVPISTDCFPAECHRCTNGTCEPANAGNSCDDANVCTDSTVCQSDGTCKPGAPPPHTATPTATRTTGIVNTATPTQPGANTATPTITVAASTATPTQVQGTPLATATLGRCVGDCNHDGKTVVNEAVTGVNIALDRAPITNCPAFDLNNNQKVEVNELVAGVGSLLHGCTAPAALR